MSAFKKGVTTIGALVVISGTVGNAGHPSPSTLTPAGRQQELNSQFSENSERRNTTRALKGKQLQDAIRADELRAAELRRREKAANLIRRRIRRRIP